MGTVLGKEEGEKNSCLIQLCRFTCFTMLIFLPLLMSITRGGRGAEVDVEGRGVRRGLGGGWGGGVRHGYSKLWNFFFNTIQKNFIIYNKCIR